MSINLALVSIGIGAGALGYAWYTSRNKEGTKAEAESPSGPSAREPLVIASLGDAGEVAPSESKPDMVPTQPEHVAALQPAGAVTGQPSDFQPPKPSDVKLEGHGIPIKPTPKRPCKGCKGAKNVLVSTTRIREQEERGGIVNSARW